MHTRRFGQVAMVAVTVAALAPAQVLASGSRWTIQATPSPNGAQRSSLYGVSCASATACTAVGDSYNQATGTDVALAEGWNGTSWVMATPNPSGATFSILVGVSCTSANACTAVGAYANSGGSSPLAERWDGSSWAIQAIPTPGGALYGSLSGISCVSDTACTAVGDYFCPACASNVPSNIPGTFVTLAERWDGSSWAIQAMPNPSGADGSFLSGVSCASATVCSAVGHYNPNVGAVLATLAERWNGTNWVIQATPNPSGADATLLYGVSCASATACTAVGWYNLVGLDHVAMAERWDGSSWTTQVTPTPSGSTSSLLQGVFCTSATACIATGEYHLSGANLTLAETWNGTSWAIEVTPNPSGSPSSYLDGVSCASAKKCTAVGFYTESGGTEVTLAERARLHLGHPRN